MLPNEVISRIKQAKVDALAGRYLHSCRRDRMKWLNRLVDFFALGIPGFYIIARLLAKNTEHHHEVEVVWEWLAGSLILLGFWKLIWWGERAEEYRVLAVKNSEIITLADEMLLHAADTTEERANSFLQRAAEVSNENREFLGLLREKSRQAAYRQALKEFGEEVVCRCGNSPWDYYPGNCQVCGGNGKMGTGIIGSIASWFSKQQINPKAVTPPKPDPPAPKSDPPLPHTKPEARP